MVHAWKACVHASVPGVQIPASPPILPSNLNFNLNDSTAVVSFMDTPSGDCYVTVRGNDSFDHIPLFLDREDVRHSIRILKDLPKKFSVPYTTFIMIVTGAIRIAMRCRARI